MFRHICVDSNVTLYAPPAHIVVFDDSGWPKFTFLKSTLEIFNGYFRYLPETLMHY